MAYQGDDANYVLITGGSGFIGSYLAQSLLEDEKCDRVILLTGTRTYDGLLGSASIRDESLSYRAT